MRALRRAVKTNAKSNFLKTSRPIFNKIAMEVMRLVNALTLELTNTKIIPPKATKALPVIINYGISSNRSRALNTSRASNTGRGFNIVVLIEAGP